MLQPKTLVCAIVALVLPACIAAAQAARTACVFPVVDLAPGAPATPAEGVPTTEADRTQSLSSAVAAEIRAAGFHLVPESQWRAGPEGTGIAEADFLDPSKTSAAARAARADVAITGFYQLEEGDRILLSVSCYDADTGGLAAGFVKRWRYNLGIYSSLHTEMRGMLSRLSLPREPGVPAQAALLAAMTFTSPQEGMEVLLPGGRSIGRIEKGRLVLAAPGTRPGDTLVVEKRMAGYHTAWQRVRSAATVPLSPLAPSSRIALETDWTFGQLIGAGAAVRFYDNPDTTFFSLSLYPYAQAPGSSWGNWLFHVDTELAFGSYLFFPPDSAFRFGAQAGLGLILSKVAAPGGSLPVYSDLYVNFLSFWLELSYPGVSFFLRPEVKMALGTGANLLGTNLIMAGSTFVPVTLGAVLKW